MSDDNLVFVIYDNDQNKNVLSMYSIFNDKEIGNAFTIQESRNKGYSTLIGKEIIEYIKSNPDNYYVLTEHNHVKKSWEKLNFYLIPNPQPSGDYDNPNERYEKWNGDFTKKDNSKYNNLKNMYVLSNNFHEEQVRGLKTWLDQNNELYYLLTDNDEVKTSWGKCGFIPAKTSSGGEKWSEKFVDLNYHPHIIPPTKSMYVLRNNKCTTLFVFNCSGNDQFSEYLDKGIDIIDNIHQMNILKIDFDKNELIHGSKKIDLISNYDETNFFNHVNFEFSEIKCKFLIIFGHGTPYNSDLGDDNSTFLFGGDRGGPQRTITSKTLLEKLSSTIPTFIFMSTCYSYNFVKDVERYNSDNNSNFSCMSIVSLFGGKFEAVYESLYFMKQYNADLTTKDSDQCFEHMFYNQLIQKEKQDNDYFLVQILKELFRIIGGEISLGYRDLINIDQLKTHISTKITNYTKRKLTKEDLISWLNENANIFTGRGKLSDIKNKTQEKITGFFENTIDEINIGGYIIKDNIKNMHPDVLFCKKDQ